MKRKRTTTILAVLATAILLLVAPCCQKAPINGDLDGQWQVMDVQPQLPQDMRDRNLYYCFQLHVCQLTQGGVLMSGNLKYVDNKITLDFPYATSPEGADSLKKWGIYSNPVTFQVEELNRKRLVMTDGKVTVTLRKF